MPDPTAEGPTASYTPGRHFLGGGESEFGDDSAQGAVKALDPLTGAIR